MKTREALANAVGSWGTDTVFALMGATNQDLLCDLSDRLGIRVVHGRHESAVVSMADGYARFSGRPGCATVTAGPGLTNTATALGAARSHRSPLLLMAGDIATGDMRNPQKLDQEGFARLLGCRSGTLHTGTDLPRLLGAAKATLADRLPFVLNLPVDAQDTRVFPRPVQTSVPPAPHADPLPIAEAAEILAIARRPAVLAGRGAVAGGAGPALRALAEQLDAMLATTLPANGLFAGHRLDIGVCGAMGDGRADRALADCDVLLAVGTSLHPLGFPRGAEATHIIRIDHSLHALAAGPPAVVALLGDSGPSVRALHGRLAARTGTAVTGCGTVVAPPRPLARDDRPYEDTRTTVDPRHALHALLPLLAPDCGIVIGGGHAAITACQMMPASLPQTWTCASVDFGAIGQSLAVAIGACFARPDRRTVHITGDGDLMMAAAELDTAVRYRLPLTVIVLNDQGFGQERHNLRRSTASSAHADHPSPDVAALARAFGAVGYRIDGPEDLHLLKQAMAHRNGTVVVDIRVNPAYQNPASALIARTFAPTPVSGLTPPLTAPCS